MKILFLDVDGPLNCHIRHSNQFCGIEPVPMMLLNWICEETECFIILSSSWRYLVLNGCMNLNGINNLFKTHGLSDIIYDVTPSDEEEPVRGKQISLWLDRNRYLNIENYVVVDDLDEEDNMRMTENHGDHFIKVDPNEGLTWEIANRIVGKLNEKENRD